MSATTCPAYEGCKAPICPLDDSFRLAIWYADEPICMARKFRREHWRIIQRRIVKKNKVSKIEGYFTLTALQDRQGVRGGIKGLSADGNSLDSLDTTPESENPLGLVAEDGVE